MVNRRLRDSNGSRDHLQRGPADAVFSEQLVGRIDDPLLRSGERSGLEPGHGATASTHALDSSGVLAARIADRPAILVAGNKMASP